MKKVIGILLILALIITMQTSIFAQGNSFYIEEIGMNIYLEDSYYNVIEELKNKESIINQNEEQKDALEKQIETYNLVFFAVDSLEKSVTKQISVAVTQTDTTKQTYDLNTFNDKKLENYYTQYIELVKQRANIEESNLIRTANNNVYIEYYTTAQNEMYDIKSYTYDTIIDGKLISINISYNHIDGSKEDANNIIENIKFDANNSKVYKSEENIATFSSMLSIILIIIMIVCKIVIKSKKEYNLSIDKKLKYKKIGGFLLVFVISIILTILLNIANLTLSDSVSSNVVGIYLVQIIIMVIIYSYILMKVFRKKENNDKKIQNLIFLLGIVNATFIFLIQCMALASSGAYQYSYYISLILNSIINLVYTITWMSYFKLSKRVKVRYSAEK